MLDPKESNPIEQCLAIKTNKEKCDSSIIKGSQYCKRHLNLIKKHKNKLLKTTTTKDVKIQFKKLNKTLNKLNINETNNIDINLKNINILDVEDTEITKQMQTVNKKLLEKDIEPIKNKKKHIVNIGQKTKHIEKKKQTIETDNKPLINLENKNIQLEKKKRGRRRKVDISDKFYNNEYLTVWPEIINGSKLLIDNDNNVYSFNIESPEYLGKKTLDCKIKKTNTN